MVVCEGLALITFARNENWQDGQGGASKGCDIQTLINIKAIHIGPIYIDG